MWLEKSRAYIYSGLRQTSSAKRRWFENLKQMLAWHLLALENANAENEGEEQLVLLKERPTHVAVDAVCEVVIQVADSLLQLVWRPAVDDRLEVDKIAISDIQL